jgi:hypothetical protein
MCLSAAMLCSVESLGMLMMMMVLTTTTTMVRSVCRSRVPFQRLPPVRPPERLFPAGVLSRWWLDCFPYLPLELPLPLLIGYRSLLPLPVDRTALQKACIRLVDGKERCSRGKLGEERSEEGERWVGRDVEA